MDEQEFKKLIQRYQDHSCSPKEKEELEMWLDSFESKEGRFDEWEEKQKRRAGKQMLTALKLKIKFGKHSFPAVINYVPLFKVAASIILLLGCGLWGYVSLVNSEKISASFYQERTSSLGVSKYILSDGTIVWLKGKSKLFYPEDFAGSKREVRLEGEALFEVAKDPSKPFIIHCGALLTKVVGTSFNIKNQPEEQQVEVVVFTGKVSLSDESNRKEIFLHPRQKALYMTRTRAITKDVGEDVADYLVGTEYDMHFEDTPVSEIIMRIEQKFSIQIKVEDEGVKQCLVSADLTDQSLSITLELISQSLGGTFQQHGDRVTLRIPGCR